MSEVLERAQENTVLGMEERSSGSVPGTWQWTSWLPLLIVAAPLAALYRETIANLVFTWWNEPGASHGFLIPLLAAYVAWTRRALVTRYPVAPENRGLSLVLAACALFLVGRLGVGYFLSSLSLLVLAAGLIWTFWGRRRLRALALPLALLAAMLPLPILIYNSFSMPLQIFASDISAELAQLLGVTVYREGNQIYLAQIRLGVAEACSGLHSLPALATAGLLLGVIYCKRMYARAALVLASLPIAVAANVVRVTGTAVLADYRPELALGFYHFLSGVLVFLVGFAMMWASAKALEAATNRRQQHA